jgi:hypothetical protein
MRQHRAAGVLLPIVALAALLAALPGCTNEPPTRTETFTIGTFNLAPLGTSGSENQGLSFSVPRPAPDRGIMVKRMRFFLADAGGRELDLPRDGIHLHHVVMLSTKAKDSACPDTGYARFGQRFAASGNEKSPILLPPGAAYHARAGDGWGAIWHVMNMGATRLDGVKLAYEIVYFEGAPDATTRDVKPYYLDVAGCEKSSFDLAGGGAPGSTVTKSATFTLPDSGRGVYTLGHLHDGGVDVTLTDPTGQPRCTATARYGEGGGTGHEHGHGEMGNIASIDLCPAPFDVAPGSWTVDARYPGDVAFTKVMGVIFMYVTI